MNVARRRGSLLEGSDCGIRRSVLPTGGRNVFETNQASWRAAVADFNDPQGGKGYVRLCPERRALVS
jgi:hypothetical protein